MGRAEKFIHEYTRNCSNVVAYSGMIEGGGLRYYKWLTPDVARKAVEIARKETLQEVKEKLLYMLNTSIDNKHFFEQLDDYIDELENK